VLIWNPAHLRAQVETALWPGLFEVWFPRILDRNEGGYRCNFDHHWQAQATQPKTLVFQSRALWLASQGWARRPDDPRYREAAMHGYTFLVEHLWDADFGGFCWRLRAREETTVKHAYGHAFGIFALTAYASVSRCATSASLAFRAFEWLDAHGHDAQHGGYHEFFTRDGIRLTDRSSALGDRDPLGTPVGHKSMNAHVHLLEAFTALYRLRPEPLLAARLTELLELVRDQMTAMPLGGMHQVFLPDWTPVPGPCSFGHDIEAAYLLLDAAAALGREPDERTEWVAKALVDHTLEWGWDPVCGGLYDAGDATGRVLDRRKVWWAQAESLNTLGYLARRNPEALRYRDYFLAQWSYVRTHQIDHRNGEWHALGRELPRRPTAKSSEWKCGYHTGRALMNVTDWLQAAEEATAAPPRESPPSVSSRGAGSPTLRG
jgi:mannobiose 2-epimerase